MAGHERFERLAVGHVLGGLDEVDAAAFRAHLLDCAACRRRVNELRDIASDLARTEREERRAVRAGVVEVETRTDTEPEPADVAPMRQWPWGIVVIGLVPLLVLGTLAWAVWQRAQTDLTAAVSQVQGEVLDVLATGEVVPFEAPDGVRGQVATDGTTVAVNITGLPELRPDEAMVVWLVDADGEGVVRSLPYLPSQIDAGLVTTLDHLAVAARLVVSVESDLGDLARPTGRELVTADLPGAG